MASEPQAAFEIDSPQFTKDGLQDVHNLYLRRVAQSRREKVSCCVRLA
jgi:hypothetical protein